MTNPSTPALKIRREFLQKHLSAVARPRDPFDHYSTLCEIEKYAEDEFRAAGYLVEKDPFRLHGKAFNNLIASRGPAKKKPPLIIGAHFDAVPGTDGADDNASGMAALLEAARVLSTLPAQPAVNFAAFNMEEYGISGSAHYARRLKTDAAKIAGMISLEMVGYTSQEPGSQKIPVLLKAFYPGTGNFLALVGDDRSAPLLQTAEKAFGEVAGLKTETLTVPLKGLLMPAVRLSDHAPFWDEGWPSLLVTDTSFFRNPHYHAPSDRVETLDLEFLERVTEGVVRMALAFSA